MNEQVFAFRENLNRKLKPSRYEHSLSVSYTCIALAMRYGGSIDQAELAGLLHDCAKQYDDLTIIKKCEKHQIEVTEAEHLAPEVLHAKYGAWMLENRFDIHDEAIKSAIACHTTGKPGMELLDKILYVADFIEPRRDKAPHLDQIRKLAFLDLDEALYRILEGTIAYLKEEGRFTNPLTLVTYDYYKDRRSKMDKI